MARKKKNAGQASPDETTTTPPVETVAESRAAESGAESTDAGQESPAPDTGEQSGATGEDPVPAEPKPKTDAHTLKPVRLHLRVNYSDAEKVEFARQMAEAQKNIEQIESEKKRANTQFKSRLESAGADRDEMMERIQSGYEMRETACTVTANTPAVGQKTITRNDTGEVVRVEIMTPDERQMELPGVVSDEKDERDESDGASQDGGEDGDLSACRDNDAGDAEDY